MHRLTAIIILAAGCCAAQPLAGPIVAIDVYGAAAPDSTRLRAVFPFRVNDLFELKETRDETPTDQLHALIGENRISIAPVFVPDLKGWVFYVDIEPPDTSAVTWRPAPHGAEKLPPKITSLY